MYITWTITLLKPTTTVGKDLLKRQVVVCSQDNQQLCLDFLWENVKLLDSIKEGDIVTMWFSYAVNIAKDWSIFNRISWTTIEPALIN